MSVNVFSVQEKFLTEQQKLLSECLREHQSLASERGQLALQQKELAEAEKKDAQRRQAVWELYANLSLLLKTSLPLDGDGT